MRRAAIVFLCLPLFPLMSRADESAQPTLTPLLTTVDLNVGESQQVELTNGKKIIVQLLDLNETRDDLRHAVRRAEVRVAVAGQAVSLVAANYQLPVTVAGVQIDCAVTKGYCHRHFKGPWQQKAKGGDENPWGLAPGDYVVRVEGTGRGGAKAVAHLHVRVEEKPPAPAQR